MSKAYLHWMYGNERDTPSHNETLQVEYSELIEAYNAMRAKGWANINAQDLFTYLNESYTYDYVQAFVSEVQAGRVSVQ